MGREVVVTVTVTSLQLCNCRYKDSCLVVGKCLAKCIVCKAEVTITDKHKLHYGTWDEEFKTRFNNLQYQLFRQKIYLSVTDLS